ncbi:MAG TPA: hypothetical protein P5543_02600 [Planctomycetota bacterium]|nr:hypothetical protein [Planctomycetota bacterium]
MNAWKRVLQSCSGEAMLLEESNFARGKQCCSEKESCSGKAILLGESNVALRRKVAQGRQCCSMLPATSLEQLFLIIFSSK